MWKKRKDTNFAITFLSDSLTVIKEESGYLDDWSSIYRDIIMNKLTNGDIGYEKEIKQVNVCMKLRPPQKKNGDK